MIMKTKIRSAARKIAAFLFAISVNISLALTTFAAVTMPPAQNGEDAFKDTQFATGMGNLLNSAKNLIQPLAIGVSAVLVIIFFFLRNATTDQQEKQQWTKRIIGTIGCGVGICAGYQLFFIIVGFFVAK